MWKLNSAAESWIARQLPNHKFLGGGDTMFDCVAYISWIQLQKECYSLYNGIPKMCS